MSKPKKVRPNLDEEIERIRARGYVIKRKPLPSDDWLPTDALKKPTTRKTIH